MEKARIDIVRASRILAAQGIVDAFGHVSMRSPDAAGHFLMSRSRAPALVREPDVLAIDLDGTAVFEPGARLFLERFIHSEIYRARPDVVAIVHSHSPQVVPFTVVPGVRVQPICHVCGFLHSVTDPFDVADFAGPASDLLIRSAELGRHFARHVGDGTVALMRGHGFTAVGGSLAEAVFYAVMTAKNCAIHLSSMLLGTPTFLNPDEARACEKTTAGQADRAWELWVHELESGKQEST